MWIDLRRLAGMTVLAGLAACGDAVNQQAPAAPAAPETNVAAVDPGNAMPSADLPDLANSQTASAALPCPATPGSMCSGPLIVRAENLSLLADGAPYSNGARELDARGNLVFENRTGAPVRFAVLRAPTDALFNNGIGLSALSTSGVAITGVFGCGRDGPECFQATPDRFQTLTPGDSPARANISFGGRMDGSLAASLPTVASATITLQLYVVDANNAGRVLNISLPNVPVQNQLSR